MITIVTIAGFVVVLVNRLLPFFRWGGAPLGYDTGFYIQNAIRLHDGLIGWSAGPFYWFWRIPIALGITPEFLVHATLLVAQLGLVLAFYTLGRALIKTFGGSTNQARIGGVIALGIFAVSLTQFLGYWWMFLRQEVAMVFLILALAALLRRRLGWAITVGGFGGAVHPATFFPLGTALVVVATVFGVRAVWQSIRNQKKMSVPRSSSSQREGEKSTRKDLRWILGVGIGMLALAVLLNPHEFRGYGSWFLQHRALITPETPSWQVPEFRGFFIDFPTLLLATLAYLPFAIVGFAMAIRALWRQWTLPTLLLVAFTLVTLAVSSQQEIIFNRRFLLILDTAFIALAVVPAARFFRWLAESPWGRRSIVGLAIGLGLNILWFAWSAMPQVTPQELREIKALRMVTSNEPNALAMATNALYTPWVYGYSRIPTIAPGYLDQNQWSLDEWEDFWRGQGGIERRHELFARYDPPIYVFVGDRGPRIDRFLVEDPAFELVSPHMWRYDGGSGI